jgi:hypothetical protein
VASRGRKLEPPTVEQSKTICGTLANFGTAKEAYTLAGVPSSTYYLWLERGRTAREKGKKDAFLEFLEKVEQADAAATMGALQNMTKASKEPKHWQSALALLRIKNPRRFGERIRFHVDGELNEFLDRLQSKVSPEVFEQIWAAYAEGADGSPSGAAEAPGQAPPEGERE